MGNPPEYHPLHHNPWAIDFDWSDALGSAFGGAMGSLVVGSAAVCTLLMAAAYLRHPEVASYFSRDNNLDVITR